jgi:hypothetical protein
VDRTSRWSTLRVAVMVCSLAGASLTVGFALDARARADSSPQTTVTSPAISTAISETRTFTVGWSASAANSYDVQSKIGLAGVWTDWKLATTEASADFTGKAGTTVFLRARSHDAAGGLGPWSAVVSTALPTDDVSGKITYRGAWSRTSAARAGAYLGTLHSSTKAGSTASFTFTGRSLGIIAFEGPKHGKLAIYLDGARRPAVIDTLASRTKARSLVYTRTWPTSKTRSVKIKVLGTSNRPLVEVDAYAVTELDSSAPIGSLTINGGATYTADRTVTLALDAADDVAVGGVQIAASTTFAGAAWHNYSDSIEWTLAAGDGPQPLYVRFRDDAGNISTPATDQITLDTTAPTTTDNAPAGWRTSSFAVTLTASDATSGMSGGAAKTEYKLDGAANWTTGASVAISSDGTHTISYRSTDAAGNVEAAKGCTVKLDKTAPTTTSDAPSSSVAAPVTVHLSASDGDGSGIASTVYTLNGGPEVTYDPAAGIVLSEAGTTTTIGYHSQDVAGNAEASKTATVTTTSKPSKPSSSSSYGFAIDATTNWHTAGQAVTIGATGGSGALTIHTSTDGGATWTTKLAASTTLNLNADGSCHVKFYASDALGQTEGTHDAGWVNIDATRPTTSDNAPPGWRTANFSVTLTPSDATSGVSGGAAKTEYKLDGAANWTTGTSVAISGDGTHTISYRSTDAAGNTETAKGCTVRLDKTAPTLSGLPGDTTATSGVDLPIPLHAADATSGLAGITLFYRTQGAPSFTSVAFTHGSGDSYSATIPGAAIGSSPLQYYVVATDAAGNSVTEPSGAPASVYSIQPSSPTLPSVGPPFFISANTPGNMPVPWISGNIVVWLAHPLTGDEIRGYDLGTGTGFVVPTSLVPADATYADGTVVWADTYRHLYGYDLASKTEFVIDSSGHDWSPAISGNTLVWRDGGYVHGYDLGSKTAFGISYAADATSTDISGTTVVWRDYRTFSNFEVYGYDLASKTEFPIRTFPGGLGDVWVAPQVSGNTVVWAEGTASYDCSIYGYDLTSKAMFPICSHVGATGGLALAISGNIVVWAQYNGQYSDVWGYDLASNTKFLINHNTGWTVSVAVDGNTVVWDTSDGLFGATLNY